MAKTPRPRFVAEWSCVCDHAFVDLYHRLCISGLTRRFIVPKLGIALFQIVFVILLKERPEGESKVNLNIDIVTPSGQHTNPQDPSSMSVQAEQDFFLITLRQMPITEEGIHRVAFRIDGDLLTTVEMPVLVQASDGPAH